MSSGIFIHGNNNKVAADAENVALINTSDYEVTSDDSGKTIFNGGAFIVDENGLSNAIYAPYSDTLSGSGSIPRYKQQASFFVDASGGNITLTLDPTETVRFFTRIDSSGNTVTLTPSSGLISGAASYNLPINTAITIISDLTNQYVTGSGGTGGGVFTDLTDVPGSYAGEALKAVRVNAGETGLEFYTPSVGGLTFGTATISFGATPQAEASVVVTGQTGILATSFVNVWIMQSDSTGTNTTDEHAFAAVSMRLSVGSLVVGVGFTIYATCMFGGATGDFKIKYSYN